MALSGTVAAFPALGTNSLRPRQDPTWPWVFPAGFDKSTCDTTHSHSSPITESKNNGPKKRSIDQFSANLPNLPSLDKRAPGSSCKAIFLATTINTIRNAADAVEMKLEKAAELTVTFSFGYAITNVVLYKDREAIQNTVIKTGAQIGSVVVQLIAGATYHMQFVFSPDRDPHQGSVGVFDLKDQGIKTPEDLGIGG